MRIIAITGLAFILAACSTTKQTQVVSNFEYIQIPTQYVDCDRRTVSIPDPATLTDEQIVSYMERLDLIVKECQTDTQSVRAWQAELIKRYMEINSKG